MRSAMAQVTLYSQVRSDPIRCCTQTQTGTHFVADVSFFTEFRFIILTHLIFGTIVRRFVNFSSMTCFMPMAGGLFRLFLANNLLHFFIFRFFPFVSGTLILAFMLSHLHSLCVQFHCIHRIFLLFSRQNRYKYI